MELYNDQFNSQGEIRYAFENGVWFIKCLGAICHPVGPALNKLIEQAIIHSESNKFVVDLTEAVIIDSTCLGILARIATCSNKASNIKPIILTGKGNIAKALLVVRFDLLFNLIHDLDNKTVATKIASNVALEQDAMLALLLDAHKRLCAIDAETHLVFKDVVETLEAETIKKLYKTKF